MMMNELPELSELLEKLRPLENNIAKLEKYIRILKRSGVDTTAYEQQLRELKARYSAMLRAIQEEMK